MVGEDIIDADSSSIAMSTRSTRSGNNNATNNNVSGGGGMKMCRQTTLPRSNTRRGQRNRRAGASQSYDDDEQQPHEESRNPRHCIRNKMEDDEEREEGSGRRSAPPSDCSLDGLSALVLGDGGTKLNRTAPLDRTNSLDHTEGGDHDADSFPEDVVAEIGVDHPSWDLLNQDSFGFNLHGTLGSLSFDTDGEILNDYHNNKKSSSGTTTALLEGSRVNIGEDVADRSGKSLSSTVTASLDDTNVDWLTSNHYGGSNISSNHRNNHHQQQQQQIHYPNHHHHHGQMMMGGNNEATMIVNSRNHNWIPPLSTHQAHHAAATQVHQHHHHQRQQQYHQHQQYHHGTNVIHRYVHPSSGGPPPPSPSAYFHHYHNTAPPPHHSYKSDPNQSLRSEVNDKTTTMRIDHVDVNDDDLFKFAFGEPNLSLPSPRVTTMTDGKKEQCVGGSGGDGDHSQSKKRKKRERSSSTPAKLLNNAIPSLQQPINERRNPSSKTTRRRNDRSSSRDASSSAAAVGSDSLRSRSHRDDTNIHRRTSRQPPPHPSTWHPHGSSIPPAPYPEFASLLSGAKGSGAVGSQQHKADSTFHSAFLPPEPSIGSSPHPASGALPPREVYIPFKAHSSAASPASKTQKGNSMMNDKSKQHLPPPHVQSMMGGYPQYAHHLPPPQPTYNYPLASDVSSQQQQRSRGNKASALAPTMSPVHPKGGWTTTPHATHHHQHHPPHQRLPGVSGTALLVLPDGKSLTRSQAPGIGWPSEEDARLTEIMANHKSSNVDWDALSLEHGMSGRTARECHDRWTRYLRPGSRKGQWKEEEDAIVLRVIFANGGVGNSLTTAASEEEGPPEISASSSNGNASVSTFTQWADLAPQLPGRTGKQIRDRWVNYLNPAINHLPFSRDDDLRLWRGHSELGKRWVEISVKVFHSTRSENHIKNRWYSAAFKKFITKEFGLDAYVDAKQAQGGNGGGGDNRVHE